jgi:hypothetical protein
MKKLALFFSVIAFVSFISITPASAGIQDTKPKTEQKVVKKACCADAKKADCKKGANCKACPKAKAKATAPAPKK